MWNDQRSERQAARLSEECRAEIFRLSLQKVSTTWTLPHLRLDTNTGKQQLVQEEANFAFQGLCHPMADR